VDQLHRAIDLVVESAVGEVHELITGGACGRQAQFQRFAKARTDKLREQGKPVDTYRARRLRANDRCVTAYV